MFSSYRRRFIACTLSVGLCTAVVATATPRAEDQALVASQSYDSMRQHGQIPAAFHQLVSTEILSPKKVQQLHVLGTLLFSAENRENRTYILTGSCALAFWAEYFAARFDMPLEYRLPHDIDVLMPFQDLGDFAASFPQGTFAIPAVTPCRANEAVQVSTPTTLIGQDGAYSFDLLCVEGLHGLSDDTLAGMDLPVLPVEILLTKVEEKHRDLGGELDDPLAENTAAIARCRHDMRTLRQIQFLIQDYNNRSKKPPSAVYVDSLRGSDEDLSNVVPQSPVQAPRPGYVQPSPVDADLF